MSMSEDDLWDASDEELEAAFKAAKAQEQSPQTDIEESPAEEDAGEQEEFTESDASDEENVEVENGSDQPEDLLEESDHDASSESDDSEAADDNTPEDEEANPDGDAETPKEESSDVADETKDEKQPTREYSFRANGKDYNFSSDEIVDQFPKVFGQAMDYTKKMQAIKPWRRTIDAIEGAKISHEDVSLMIDVLKGDKEAITEVLKRTGVDTLELNTEEDSNYVAKDYGRDESALAISEVVDEISRDAEYVTTHNILSNDWDEKSWETLASEPEKIRLLHEDVKSGMYQTLQPTMEKLKVFDGGTKSDLEYYAAAAQQHFNKIAEQRNFETKVAPRQPAEAPQKPVDDKSARVAQAKAQSEKRNEVKKASAKRKAAAPSKSASVDRVVDYLDDSDESFDEWYKKLQDSM